MDELDFPVGERQNVVSKVLLIVVGVLLRQEAEAVDIVGFWGLFVSPLWVIGVFDFVGQRLEG